MKNALPALAVALALVAGCRRTDVRDFAVSIPDLAAEDQSAIAVALAPYSGIDRTSLKFDMASKMLSLRYDSMQLAKKNIELAIAKAGFAANGVTPESVGAAPKRK